VDSGGPKGRVDKAAIKFQSDQHLIKLNLFQILCLIQNDLNGLKSGSCARLFAACYHEIILFYLK
jgi:hypothetical protein